MRRRMIIDRRAYEKAVVSLEMLEDILRDHADHLDQHGDLTYGRKAIDAIESLLFGAYDVWEDETKYRESLGNDGDPYRNVRTMRLSRSNTVRV